MPKSKNCYDRLDMETKEIVTGIALIIFLLILVFFLTNPVGAAVTFGIVGLAGFPSYSKHKTGRWWWTNSSPPATPVTIFQSEPAIRSVPLPATDNDRTGNCHVRSLR